MADARLNIKVDADAKQASAAFKDLASDLKAVGSSSVGLVDAVTKAGDAFKKLEQARDTPAALAAGMAKARQAVQELQAALAKTTAGTAEYQRISDALTKAGAAMQSAAGRAAYLKKVQDDVAISVRKMGTATEQAAGQTTRLGDAIRKQTEGFNKFRGSVMEVWAAFNVGRDIGNALSEVIKKVDASMAAHDKRMSDAAVNSIKFEAAMRLVQKGLLDVGGTQEQFLAKYDAYVAKMREGTKALEDQRRAAAEYQMTLKDLDGIIGGAKGRGFTILSPEDAAKQLDGIKALAKGLEDAFKKAFDVGGERERAKWAVANEDAVQKVIDAYKNAGLEIPEHINAISDAQATAAIAANGWSREQIEALGRANVEWERAGAAIRAQTTAVEAAERANQDFGTSLDRVAEAVVATGGQMVVGAPYWIQITQATKEATQALLDYMVASKALREEQAAALEATKGWTDYILALKDGYESGTTSLYNYKVALGEFKTQLLQLFGSAKGEARESLQAIIDMINELMRTAGAGGSPTAGGGPVAWLDKAVRDSKRGG